MNPGLKSKLGNYWVFREGRREVDGPAFVRNVLAAFDLAVSPAANSEMIISALLISGELESALADIGSRNVPVVQAMTDFLADRLIGRAPVPVKEITKKLSLSQISVPKRISISAPEGFSYYALHPSDFANLATQVPEHNGPVAIIGIRSIGTTLSAVVGAADREIGHCTERITVRPSGHPYERTTEFTHEQLDWIKNQISRGAQFQVVDEGPGRSGSSFLSVGEALVKTGVDRDCITFLGSRVVDVSQLCARDAVERWTQFRFYSPITQIYERFKDDFYVGGGDWRNFFEASRGDWPPSWPQMERLKFLSADRKRLFKFEGFGRFGKEVLDRANRLAEAGFGPATEDAGDGMLSYAVVPGRHPLRRDVDRNVLQRVAEYCAFRVRAYPHEGKCTSQLGEMVCFNLEAEFGPLLNFSPELLHTENPVLVDGRMQPHEWIVREDGILIKADGTTHGDDHFFPGPTDIAWDIAGAIVEWRLDENAREFLLERYFRASGDDLRNRIDAFLLAYAMFRVAYCGMALTTVAGTSEAPRLEAAHERYWKLAAERVKKPAVSAFSFSRRSAVPIESSSHSGDD
jgi:hypothetical protein